MTSRCSANLHKMGRHGGLGAGNCVSSHKTAIQWHQRKLAGSTCRHREELGWSYYNRKRRQTLPTQMETVAPLTESEIKLYWQYHRVVLECQRCKDGEEEQMRKRSGS